MDKLWNCIDICFEKSQRVRSITTKDKGALFQALGTLQIAMQKHHSITYGYNLSFKIKELPHTLSRRILDATAM